MGAAVHLWPVGGGILILMPCMWRSTLTAVADDDLMMTMLIALHPPGVHGDDDVVMMMW